MAGWTDLGGEKLRWDGRLEDNYGGTFPQGAIAIWSGTLASIPKGWQLCDGTNGAPDLRASFIRGAVAGAGAGATGGCDKHCHTSGSFSAPACSATQGVTTGLTNVSQSCHTHNAFTGISACADSFPVYYSVLFIQKI